MNSNRFTRWWLALLLLCLAIPLHAQTVQIDGYEPLESSYDYPLFEITSSSITLSLGGLGFNYVYIDDTEIEYNSSSDLWRSYILDVTPYLDGEPHTVLLKSGSIYANCYIISYSAFVGDLLYEVSNGEAKVVAAKKDATSIEIPSTYEKNGESYPVTSIGNNAFRDRYSLTSVTIPESVTSIYGSAFSCCTSLISVTIPESVTSIYDCAFSGCTSLTSVTIPASVTNMGEFAFQSCISLTSVTSEASIGARAFMYCDSLTSVTFSESVTSIEYAAFEACTSLTSVKIPESVTYLGPEVFSGCTSLTSVDIPPSLTTIGWSTFSGCTSLTSVAIPESVTYLGYQVFRGCTSLTSVTIPESVTSIEDSAFSDCTSLTSLTFNAMDCTKCGSSSEPAFPSTISSLTFGENVTKIPPYLLVNGSSIEQLTIPNSVTSIGEKSFYNSNGLKSVTFGSGLLSIGADAVPNGVIAKAFWLGNTPPSNYDVVNAIENFAVNDLYACRNLKIYQSLGSKFSVDGTVYVPSTPEGLTCDVVDCVYTDGNTAVVISDKVTNQDIEMTVKDINDYAFYENDYIESLQISNDGTVGYAAFRGCDKLQEAYIANQGQIGGYSFWGCSGLQAANIENNGNIGISAFGSCQSLQTAHISNNGDIEKKAFTGCVALKSVNISNNGNICDYAFSREATYDRACVALESAIINNNGVIGYSSFDGCKSLSEVNLGDRVKGIGRSAFSGCTSLSEIIIPDSVASMDPYPFLDCTALKSAVIGKGLTSLPIGMFYGCSSLVSLDIPDNVMSIAGNAFSGCTSLDYLSLGNNLESIGMYAFSGCSALTNFYSFSAVPPVCESNALDDINKSQCTLFVPAGSGDEYMAADQWKDFSFVNEMAPVFIEEIRLNSEEIAAMTDETFQLEAEILPANATKKRLEWSSSDPAVVTVDEAGLATFVGHGNAVITASATDGSGVTASVVVTVWIKQPDLGDSNANGVINIADAVNTANYAIGNEVEHISLEAADVNQDGNVTLADASATVTLILNQPATPAEPAKVRALDTDAADLLIIEKSEDHSADREDLISFDVRLDSMREFVAMQAEISAPAGMTLESVTCGAAAAGHALATRRMDERTMRVILFDPDNTALLTDGEALLQLELRTVASASGDIEIRNIVASDAQAHEYRLAAVSADGNISTGISVTAETEVEVMTAPGVIEVCNAKGEQIAVYTADGASIVRFIADEDIEHIYVAPGVYVVVSGTERVKVIVK